MSSHSTPIYISDMSDNLSNTTWPDENIFTFEDPLSDPTALQSAHNILQKQVVNLQTKNEQWIKLFKQVEKGMSIKLAELDSLTKENRNLKIKNSRLLQELEQCHVTKTAVHPLDLVKRVRQLEDQVRARDLVIELMKKAEKERVESEMKEKLEIQRRDIEQQLGIAIGRSVQVESSTMGGGQYMKILPNEARSPRTTRSQEIRNVITGKQREGRIRKGVSTRCSGRHDVDDMEQRSGGHVVESEGNGMPTAVGENRTIDTEGVSSEIDEEMEEFFNE